MRTLTNWLRRRLNRDVIAELQHERLVLARAHTVEHGTWYVANGHTHGMVDGLERAISIVESDR